MKKSSHKRVKFTPEERAYELPEQIDLASLHAVGSGAAAVKKLAERSKHVVSLDPDVARDFRDSESVNEALRLVQSMRKIGQTRKHRKSA
jgi:hypothetical protein